jgi:hypothetical protein
VAPSTATGTVTFSDGTTVLGTGTLIAGIATYSATSLATGMHSITAVYAGDPDDAPSTSTPLAITVTAPSFQLSATPSSLTITQGSSGTAKIAVTPVGSYSGTVSFTCGGLPANSSCSFSPASLTLSGAAGEPQQTTTLTITTNVSAQASLQTPVSGLKGRGSQQIVAAAIFGLPGIVLISLCRRKLLRRGSAITLGLLLIIGTSFSFSGCGSGSSNHTPTGPVTPTGTSTVVISATGGATPLNITLTVEP